MEYRVRLSEDMLIELLILLPIKSLMRFKSVSKYWFTLIKSPTFLNRHLYDRKKILLVKRYLPSPNSNSDNVDLLGGEDILSFHDLDFPDKLTSPSITVPFLDDLSASSQVEFKGPCNGLVCILSGEIIVFCNPALREFKLLESGPFACPEAYSESIEGAGFGFDAKTNSYKVMQMWHVDEIYANYYDHDEYMRIDLYNSSTNSWKIIDVDVPRIRYDPGFDVLFNGACHWQANKFIKAPPAMGIILAFDLSTEEFRQIEFPDWFEDEKNPGLVVLNECLAIIRYEEWLEGYMEEPHLIDIWIMKEYGVKESWTKELVIGPYIFKVCLLCWRNEWLFVENSNGQLESCAIHGNQVTRFQFHGFEESFRALIFKESIISLSQVLSLVEKETI